MFVEDLKLKDCWKEFHFGSFWKSFVVGRNLELKKVISLLGGELLGGEHCCHAWCRFYFCHGLFLHLKSLLPLCCYSWIHSFLLSTSFLVVAVAGFTTFVAATILGFSMIAAAVIALL